MEGVLLSSSKSCVLPPPTHTPKCLFQNNKFKTNNHFCCHHLEFPSFGLLQRLTVSGRRAAVVVALSANIQQQEPQEPQEQDDNNEDEETKAKDQEQEEEEQVVATDNGFAAVVSTPLGRLRGCDGSWLKKV
ncbi:hypothetical protein Tco_1553300 [Tanacetum coccineum]